jgi:hypothetical protein
MCTIEHSCNTMRGRDASAAPELAAVAPRSKALRLITDTLPKVSFTYSAPTNRTLTA